MGSFLNQIEEFERKVAQRYEAVRVGASQDVAEAVVQPVKKGGHMRVDTGFLRGSFIGSTESMPTINPNAKPPETAGKNSFGDNLGQINLVIAQAKNGETVYMGFTAAYARPREYRDGFVRLAAQRWDSIVYENVLKAQKAFP